MTEGIRVLSITAASVALLHTLLGPDHYLPFIVMSKAGRWSMLKTIWVTFLSGVGHVTGSVILGLLGVGFGLGVNKLTNLESGRGSLAAWMLIAFGFAYLIWGIRRVYKNKKHSHLHVHDDGTYHTHIHNHKKDHLHLHEDKVNKKLTPWVLFVIFILGPCEPLIPIVMYPAAEHDYLGLIWVTVIFGVITILTMLSVVVVSTYGFNFLPLGKLEKYAHALAGGTILLSGLAIVLLGL